MNRSVESILKLAQNFQIKVAAPFVVDIGAYQDVLNGGTSASGGWRGFLGVLNNALLSGGISAMNSVPDTMGFKVKIDISGDGNNYKGFVFRLEPLSGVPFDTRAAATVARELQSKYAQLGVKTLRETPHPENNNKPIPPPNGKITGIGGPIVKPA